MHSATFVTGLAEAGAYVGTACVPPVVVGVGEGFGVVLGGEGECFTTPPTGALGRVARKIPPPMLSRIRSANPIAAGMSQAGRSLVRRSGGRVDGLRAGAEGCVTVDDEASAGMVEATPAGASFGVHAGVATGVQVCAGAAGAAGGGDVEVGGGS